LLERVRVRQGEGGIPLPPTPSRKGRETGRENYKEFGHWDFELDLAFALCHLILFEIWDLMLAI